VPDDVLVDLLTIRFLSPSTTFEEARDRAMWETASRMNVIAVEPEVR